MARYYRRSHRPGPNRFGIRSIIIVVVILVAVVWIWIGRDKQDRSTDANTLIPLELPVAESGTAPQLKEPTPPQPEPNIITATVMPAAAESSNSDVSSEVSQAFAEAMALLRAEPHSVIEVRDRLNDTLKESMSQEQRILIKDKLADLADQWLFSQTVYPGDTLCNTYQVKPGDQLRIIGDHYKVPFEILLRMNRLARPEALKAGTTIKVPQGPFHAKVYRSSFTMDLYLNTTFVKSYPVGLGKTGRETPTGLWVVELGGKHISPQWKDPDTGRTYRSSDPDYPLGSRWIGLQGLEGNAVGRVGIAIHGTKDPNQIGQQGSRGCVRLYNGDVIEVYSLLYPGLSKVQIED